VKDFTAQPDDEMGLLFRNKVRVAPNSKLPEFDSQIFFMIDLTTQDIYRNIAIYN